MKRKQLTSNKNAKGFTLLEFLGVIAAGALLVTGITLKMQGKFDDNKVNTISDEINVIMQAMLKCGGYNDGDYTNCDIEELVRLDDLDTDYGTGVGVNPFNGDYASAVVAGNTNRFTISATGIPKDEYGAKLIEMFNSATAIAPTYDAGTGTFTTTWGVR